MINLKHWRLDNSTFLRSDCYLICLTTCGTFDMVEKLEIWSFQRSLYILVPTIFCARKGRVLWALSELFCSINRQYFACCYSNQWSFSCTDQRLCVQCNKLASFINAVAHTFVHTITSCAGEQQVWLINIRFKRVIMYIYVIFYITRKNL